MYVNKMTSIIFLPRYTRAEQNAKTISATYKNVLISIRLISIVISITDFSFIIQI